MWPRKVNYGLIAAAAIVAAGLSGAWLAQPASSSAVIIPAGTSMRVNLDRAVASSRNRPGEQFQATLCNPVLVGGRLMIPAGTEVGGKIVSARGGRSPANAATLRLTLDFIRSQGQTYEMHTTDVVRYRREPLNADPGLVKTATLGSPSVAGGIQDVSIPAEATLNFRLIEPLRLPAHD